MGDFAEKLLQVKDKLVLEPVPVYPPLWLSGFKEPYAEEKRARALKVHSLLLQRGIQDHDLRERYIKQYAHSLKIDSRQNKVIQTICRNDVTYRLFKEWLDRKLNYIKPSKL